MEGHSAPFSAPLDIGLTRATKGAKVFSVAKELVHSGIHVAHNESNNQMVKKEHVVIHDNSIIVNEEKEVEKKRWNAKKMTLAERKSRVSTKKAYLLHLKAKEEAQ